jgi:hypothetical protein
MSRGKFPFSLTPAWWALEQLNLYRTHTNQIKKQNNKHGTKRAWFDLVTLVWLRKGPLMSSFWLFPLLLKQINALIRNLLLLCAAGHISLTFTALSSFKLPIMTSLKMSGLIKWVDQKVTLQRIIFGFCNFQSNKEESTFNCPVIPPLFHTVHIQLSCHPTTFPHSSLHPPDISPNLALSAIQSQLFPPGAHISISGRQDFVSGTNYPAMITTNVRSFILVNEFPTDPLKLKGPSLHITYTCQKWNLNK